MRPIIKFANLTHNRTICIYFQFDKLPKMDSPFYRPAVSRYFTPKALSSSTIPYSFQYVHSAFKSLNYLIVKSGHTNFD